MTDTSMTSAPVTEKQRYGNLDFIRGVALFGILLMNIHWMHYGYDPYILPTMMAGDTGANLGVWITTSMIFEGTQRATFSMLFGAGMILLTMRLEESGREDVAAIYYRRITWMLIFGLMHGYLLLWQGDILYYYAVPALFLYPFRKLAAKILFAIGIAWLLYGNVMKYNNYNDTVALAQINAEVQSFIADGGTPSSAQLQTMQDWRALNQAINPDQETQDAMIAAHRSNYQEAQKFSAPIIFADQIMIFSYMYDTISMMFIGMALFKMGILTLMRSNRFYWGMVIGSYSIGLPVNYFEVIGMIAADFDLLVVLKHGLTYDVGRLTMTIGHLGLLILFYKSGFFGWLQRSLAAVGRMALTNYISQSIITSILFNGFGFGLYATMERYELYYIVFAIWIFQLIISPIWLQYYRFGPLEWLWRTLTYVKRQPMRRQSIIGAAAQVKN